jgi:hypothetical protein
MPQFSPKFREKAKYFKILGYLFLIRIVGFSVLESLFEVCNAYRFLRRWGNDFMIKKAHRNYELLKKNSHSIF